MLRKIGEQVTFKELLDLKFGCQVMVMTSSVNTCFWKYNADLPYKRCYSLDLCVKYPFMTGNVDATFLKSFGTEKKIWILDNKGCADQIWVPGCH